MFIDVLTQYRKTVSVDFPIPTNKHNEHKELRQAHFFKTFNKIVKYVEEQNQKSLKNVHFQSVLNQVSSDYFCSNSTFDYNKRDADGNRVFSIKANNKKTMTKLCIETKINQLSYELMKIQREVPFIQKCYY